MIDWDAVKLLQPILALNKEKEKKNIQLGLDIGHFSTLIQPWEPS